MREKEEFYQWSLVHSTFGVVHFMYAAPSFLIAIRRRIGKGQQGMSVCSSGSNFEESQQGGFKIPMSIFDAFWVSVWKNCVKWMAFSCLKSTSVSGHFSPFSIAEALNVQLNDRQAAELGDCRRSSRQCQGKGENLKRCHKLVQFAPFTSFANRTFHRGTHWNPIVFRLTRVVGQGNGHLRIRKNHPSSDHLKATHVLYHKNQFSLMNSDPVDAGDWTQKWDTMLKYTGLLIYSFQSWPASNIHL